MNVDRHDPLPRAINNARLAKNTSTSNNPAINFYPEGGAIVTGINSTLALQVADAKGNPLATAGYIVNNRDSIVANFTTNKSGLARVAFYPLWYLSYKAVIHQNNQDIAYPLPAFNPFAAQLSLTGQNDTYLNATVALEDSLYSRLFKTTIIGISGGNVCFAATGSGNYQASIPVTNFPAGIATLLLYDDGQHLLSERKVFINKNNYSIGLQTNKQNFAARDSVRINMAVTDDNGNPIVAALNVSVQDARIQKMSDYLETDTLQPAALTLNDWLKRNAKRYSAADIDLLMLAQPPEFKNWKTDSLALGVEGNEETELLRYLHGTITDRKNRPLNSLAVTEISLKSDDSFFDVDTTNKEGKFRLPIPQNRDSLLLNLQVTDKTGYHHTTDNLVIDTFNFPHFATPASLKEKFFAEGVTVAQLLKTYHIDTVFKGVGKGWLAPVTVKTKKKRAASYVTSKRVDPFSYVITSDKFQNGGHHGLVNALLSLPGVMIRQGFVTFLGGNGQGATPATEPIIIMDGAQMYLPPAGGDFTEPDPSAVLKYLNGLDPESIDFVEVLTGGNAAMYGVRGANGVILINSKSRSAYAKSSPNSFAVVAPLTYHVAPDFTMPDYNDRSVRNNKAPDARNTIYWNGGVVTGTNGKTSVGFFTADVATNYIVTITGITQNGDYIYKQITLNRK